MRRRDGKAAVISMTQSGGPYLIRHVVSLNAVEPGGVDGAHWNRAGASFCELGDKKPVERLAGAADRSVLPETSTGMHACLPCAEADFKTQCFNADCGQWMN